MERVSRHNGWSSLHLEIDVWVDGGGLRLQPEEKVRCQSPVGPGQRFGNEDGQQAGDAPTALGVARSAGEEVGQHRLDGVLQFGVQGLPPGITFRFNFDGPRVTSVELSLKGLPKDLYFARLGFMNGPAVPE